MAFHFKRSYTRIVLGATSFVIVGLILWNTNAFFRKFKEEERLKMEIWASAQAELQQTEDLERELGELPLIILRKNLSTPMVVVNSYGDMEVRNIDSLLQKDTAYMRRLIDKFALENNPIKISYRNEVLGTLYYGDSGILNKLKFYPIALLLIIFLFATVIFFFFRTSRVSELNRLWAGMAKETAHQIGTPLSSLLGWNEILKSEKLSTDITTEIAKDIDRLQTITERFSKIGSLPTLKPCFIVAETKKAFLYLKDRSSKLIVFEFQAPETDMEVLLNPPLYAWTIENLVKNAIDAMKGKGKLGIKVLDKGGQVRIHITDEGKGVPRKQQKAIFDPGVTTKRRGWGLGLSLAKRIIENYHKGKIHVLSSGKQKGTTMEITLKKLKKG